MNTSKRYRLLLHIGFPKTATTSLQHNVLMPLHEEGSINFIGRRSNYPDVYDLLQEHGCYSFMERLLSQDEIPELRRQIESLLDPSKLNVLSNESLSAAWPIYRNTAAPRVILTNMAELFENCDVVLMLSLREPTALLLSMYAENIMYPIPGQEPLEFSQVINDSLSRPCIEDLSVFPLFYDHYIPLVAQYFSNIKILLYEDIQDDPACYFRQLADCLGMDDPQRLRQLFGLVRYNADSRHSSDELSIARRKQVGVGRALRTRFGCARWVHGIILKRFPLLLKLWRYLSFKIYLRAEYTYPDTETRELVRAKLSVSTDYLTKTLGVDPDKLVRYGYCADSPERPARGA